MYKILQYGKKTTAFGTKCFKSYDAARNAVRKYLRNWYGPFDGQPALSDFSYTVKKI